MDDPERVEGVDFTGINPVLNDISYPITTAEFVEQYGGRELGRTNADPIAVAELFEEMGADTFDAAEEIREMALAQMPRNTGGRANYSDRGGATPTETEAANAVAEQPDPDTSTEK